MSNKSRAYSWLKWSVLCALILCGMLLFLEQAASAGHVSGFTQPPAVIHQAGPLLGITPTPTMPTPTNTPVPPTPIPTRPVDESANPVIVKRVEPTEASPGGEVKFIIEVTNTGQQAAVDVVVTDEISEYLEILEVTTTQGSVTVDGQTVTVYVGVVGPDFVVEIIIRTRLRKDVRMPLTLENVAFLDSPNGGGGKPSTPITITIPNPILPVTGKSGLVWPLWVILSLSLLLCGLWLGLRRDTQHNRLG